MIKVNNKFDELGWYLGTVVKIIPKFGLGFLTVRGCKDRQVRPFRLEDYCIPTVFPQTPMSYLCKHVELRPGKLPGVPFLNDSVLFFSEDAIHQTKIRSVACAAVVGSVKNILQALRFTKVVFTVHYHGQPVANHETRSWVTPTHQTRLDVFGPYYTSDWRESSGEFVGLMIRQALRTSVLPPQYEVSVQDEETEQWTVVENGLVKNLLLRSCA